MSESSIYRFFACIPLLFSLAGCAGQGAGYETVDISGAVTVEGVPVKNGALMYFPGGKNKGSGGKVEIVDGKYTIEDLPKGSCNFRFSALKETGKMISGPSDEQVPETVNIIPEGPRITGVVREVSASGTQDFNLKESD